MAKLHDNLRKSPILRLIEEEARAWDEPVYLVGGMIRDVLWDSPSKLDFDIAVGGSAKAFADKLAGRLMATCFVLHESTQIYRIALKAKGRHVAQVDVAQVQGGGIEDDLSRRDFTVNALALKLPLSGTDPIDPTGGLKDIKGRILKATGDEVFPKDPIRLLRAFRIAANLDLRIDRKTLADIHFHRTEITKSAGERIRHEFLGILSSLGSAPWLKCMDETGLLTQVFPELEASRKCAEVYYGKGGALKHSIEVVERMDYLIPNLADIYADLAAPINDQMLPIFDDSVRHTALLRLSALLHDVAKPACAKKVDGRLRFFGHEAKGAKMAAGILERLRFSSKETEMVSTVIRHHLRPGNLAANEAISDKAVYRFFRDLGDYGVSLLLLCWSDHASYLSPAILKKNIKHIRKHPSPQPCAGKRESDTTKTVYHLQVISYLLQHFFFRPDVSRPVRFLTGHDVMKNFKIEPGPRLGEILKALEEAQAEGRVKNREDAMRFVRFNFQ